MTATMSVPCTIMRGGTSKGIFIHSDDLPKDAKKRDEIILGIFGSPDVRQIDGLGGADPLTSKLAVIGPTSHPEADVDYTFCQVGIDQPVLDFSGNCGNISSGVGPFAIDKSLVAVTEPVTTVRIHNTNTGKILVAEVEVVDGRAKTSGDCKIAGVPGTGSPIMLNFAGTAGSVTGKLLPTENVVDLCELGSKSLEVSIVDCANPMVFVRAEDMGISGTEGPNEIDGNETLLQNLEDIRCWAAIKLGMAANSTEATEKSPAFPMIAMVSKPSEYRDFTSGNTIREQDVSLVSRLMFMQVLHKTYAGTGTICTGVAAKISGTIVNQMVSEPENLKILRIGHPAGVISIEVEVKDFDVTRAAISRTARRIMDGHVYIKQEQT